MTKDFRLGYTKALADLYYDKFGLVTQRVYEVQRNGVKQLRLIAPQSAYYVDDKHMIESLKKGVLQC